MNLTFSPVAGWPSLAYEVAGDVLSVAGVAYDFGDLEEGDVLPSEAVPGAWLASSVQRTGGVLRLEVIQPVEPFGEDREEGHPLVAPGEIDWTQVQTQAGQEGAALAARRASMVCSRLQGRLVLGEAVCAQVDALAVDPALPWAMRETIASAIEWQRLSPTMDELAWILDFEPEQMDALFEQAMTLAV